LQQKTSGGEEEFQENYQGIDYELGKKVTIDSKEVKDLFFIRVETSRASAISTFLFNEFPIPIHNTMFICCGIMSARS
jgi:hypothetical protein